jgi:hypothetical protein
MAEPSQGPSLLSFCMTAVGLQMTFCFCGPPELQATVSYVGVQSCGFWHSRTSTNKWFVTRIHHDAP